MINRFEFGCRWDTTGYEQTEHLKAGEVVQEDRFGGFEAGAGDEEVIEEKDARGLRLSERGIDRIQCG